MENIHSDSPSSVYSNSRFNELSLKLICRHTVRKLSFSSVAGSFQSTLIFGMVNDVSPTDLCPDQEGKQIFYGEQLLHFSVLILLTQNDR